VALEGRVLRLLGSPTFWSGCDHVHKPDVAKPLELKERELYEARLSVIFIEFVQHISSFPLHVQHKGVS
jgi:hypothetical protein